MSKKRTPHTPQKLLSPRAQMGLMAIFIQPWLLSLRSADLSNWLHPLQAAATGTQAVGMPLAADPTLGATLVLAAMLAASVYKMEASSAHPCPYLRFFSASGWLMLTGVDLFLSVNATPGPWQNQFTAFGLEGAKIAMDTLFGILIVEHTLPAFLAKKPSIGEVLTHLMARKRGK